MATNGRRRSVHRLRNILHSVVLVLGMALIAAACAWALWGWEGVLWAVGAVVLAMGLSPSIPPGLVLSLYRARPMSRAEFPEGYALSDELARRAGLPVPPRLHYVPSAVANAFAVGNRQDAALAVSDGMLRTLTARELAGVLAHEISHVANNDLWIMNLADAMSRATALLSNVGIVLLALNLPLVLMGAVAVPWSLILVLVLSPTAMSLLQLALSRAREYEADLGAAGLTGDPAGLASALLRLERQQGRIWESILMPGRNVPDPSLLRTHPPTAERVRRLMDLAEHEPRPDEGRRRPVVLPGDYRVVGSAPRWRWPGLWY
ncbi:peptidase M48 [Thalassobaculum fulvum]|uniref:Peptidase M48 n=1 Tax=Thalassobaculum fulvum TaxID=1633335 RepID=A0A918XT20_9PROT|nr:zinc metalloprotease HtpX [Thalassobaculum fulvum]GHD53857.1 peptidase M48 [Thalassobaculum fulvum]